MKHEVDTAEAARRLPALIEAARQGEDVTLMDGGVAVARLVAARPEIDRERALAAVERIKLARVGVRLGPGLTIRDLIDEGRR